MTGGRSRPGLVAALLVGLLVAASANAQTGVDARTSGLLDFIGSLEAPGGYDSYSGYAAKPPPKPLTTMTVAEVLAWQDSIDAASRSEAAGRYQIMEDTLRAFLVPAMGLTGRERFTPAMQDAMAARLLERRGWHPNRRRYTPQEYIRLGNAIAHEWAALPLVSGPDAGQSAHHATPGVRNRALTTPEAFLAVLRNPADQGMARAAANRSRHRLAAARIAGSDITPLREITRTRPLSPGDLTGGPLAPSRIITYRIDPYAQN